MTIDEIKWVRSPTKKGGHKDDYVLSIPRNYIRTGYVDPDMVYEVTLKPIYKKNPIKDNKSKIIFR